MYINKLYIANVQYKYIPNINVYPAYMHVGMYINV